MNKIIWYKYCYEFKFSKIKQNFKNLKLITINF